LLLELELGLDVLELRCRDGLTRLLLPNHQLFESVDRVVEEPNAVVGHSGDPFVEVTNQISDRLD